MAWKTIDGARYLYRSVREGDHVRAEYVGCGPIYELFAEIQTFKRLVKRRQREADLRGVAEYRADQARVGFDPYFKQVEGIAHAAMELAGYHRHERSEWRKRRMATELNRVPGTLVVSEANPSFKSDERRILLEFMELTSDEVFRRRDLARDGDPEMLEWFRQVFMADPSGQLSTILEGDVQTTLREIVARRAVGDNPLAQVAFTTQGDRLGRELAGETPSALEQVLCERAALAWMTLQAEEVHYERTKDQQRPETAKVMEQRLARLNRRFNEACKTLAVVRKHALPAIRTMFVAEQQMNVTSG